jgi:M6 family metalloprotease-like protein
MKQILLFLSALFILATSSYAESIDNDPGLNKPQWNKKFAPKRTKPIFTGAFSVGVVLIDFPDTKVPSLAALKNKSFNFSGLSAKEYFKEYSQGICWPEIAILGEKSFPKNIYRAPKPIGYYCEYDFWNNPLGYKNRAEGGTRAKTLKTAAMKHAYSKYKLPSELPSRSGRAQVNCVLYASQLKSSKEWNKLISPYYKNRKHPFKANAFAWEFYKPKINWSDPLWPNSSVQVRTTDGGGTFCHELGHVIGAPDFYHCPEKFDGVPGNPCLGCAYGPTGPGYCRYIYNAFLTEKNYPTLSKSGRYTLAARKTNPAGEKSLGCFIPSKHPHYIYHLEYVSGEKAPLGNPGKKGLLVHLINVTMNAPYMGSPDMCYTYHANDPWFRSSGTYAYFGKAHGRTSFSKESEPASRLPNLLDGGMSFEIVEENNEEVTFDLKVDAVQVKGNDYKLSLIPKISLEKISEVLPSSIRAHCNILYRGEPLMTEYGFCWDMRPRPTLREGSYLPLYHRDRYDARILNLRPRMKYYVRAYVRNKYGVSYSKEELTVVMPEKGITTVPPLLDDSFSANWMIQMYHKDKQDSSGEGTTVGSSALTSLLKLVTYYRTPFATSSSSGRSRSSSRSKSKGNTALDYRRIHTQPTLGKPDFRVVEFNQAVALCANLAKDSAMTGSEFKEDFNKNFLKYFKIKTSRSSSNKPIETLLKDQLSEVGPKILKSLISGNPVLIGQAPALSSPIQYGLSWVLIDGINDKGQYHLIYPGGKDRQYKRKAGWHKWDTLFEGVKEARIFWNFKPIK